VLVALANLQRRRRRDTAPRAPFADAGGARRALAEEGVAIAVLSQGDLPALARLADAVSGLADCLALRRPPASRALEVINELASGCTGAVQLIMGGRAVQSDMGWHDPDPVAGLARRVIEEFDGIDPSRLRQCQRKECDLLFFDMTRSRSQRWHAENPCGWLERQHRRRGGLRYHCGRDWRSPRPPDDQASSDRAPANSGTCQRPTKVDLGKGPWNLRSGNLGWRTGSPRPAPACRVRPAAGVSPC
jgi:CGNR zinc finger